MVISGGDFVKREYLEENVYDAFLNRMKLIFEEFDNIFISFSGRKRQWIVIEFGVGLPK